MQENQPIKQILSDFKQWFEPHLQRLAFSLPENDPAQKRLKSAIFHSLFGNAKRIRAFLIGESCRHFNISPTTVLPLMLAIELVHCYSLIHDDLPCMDNSSTRRGKPSLHVEFDEATALLTGNAILNLAFDSILSNSLEIEGYVKINLLKNLSKAIGYSGMMGGQMFDIIISNSQQATAEEFIHMNKMKTGELFAFCLATGAICTRSLQVHEMEQLGYEIGSIFQLVDDLLDEDDTNAQNFINKLGGKDDALNHLKFITDQCKTRAQKLCSNTHIHEIISYITNQINL